MTSSIGCTITPLTKEDSSCQVDTHSWCVEELKGKDDTVEHLAALLEQETKLYPPCNDYLSDLQQLTSSADSDPVSESWRRKLCEWCFEVVDHFKFDREAVAIALNYLDRSVSKWTKQFDTPIPKREFQLLAVTSLYMAIKIHGEADCDEGPRRKLKIDAFYELSRKQFEVEVIEKTEMQILKALNWNVNPPTALKFIATYLFLCPKWQKTDRFTTHACVMGGIYDVARYLTELSVCQSYFSFSCKTSVVAFAAILVSIESLASSLPLPSDVQTMFLNNILLATGLASTDPDVLRACDMLKKLCPNLFSGNQLTEDLHVADLREDLSVDGKTSPVCVVDSPEDLGARRKRCRSAPATDENWRPIHN